MGLSTGFRPEFGEAQTPGKVVRLDALHFNARAAAARLPLLSAGGCRMILDGEARIAIGGDPQTIAAGQMLIMPADVPHALKAETSFKMLLVMIRGME
jgi:hypothetical protein